MYASQLTKYFGDKMTLYISKHILVCWSSIVLMALFVIPYRMEKGAKEVKAEEKKVEDDG